MMSWLPGTVVRRWIVVFLVGLSLVVAIWFASGALLRNKLVALATETDMKLEFSEISWMSGSVALHDVQLISAQLSKPVFFPIVVLSPDWSLLFAGAFAANINFSGEGFKFKAIISEGENSLFIQNVNVQINEKNLAEIVKSLLGLPGFVELAGNMGIRGGVLVDRMTGAVDSGSFDVDWRGAKVGMMGAEFALGNLLLRLQSEPSRWNWTLEDGGIGFIDAKGIVLKQSGPMATWPVLGDMNINGARAGKNSLSSGLPADSDGIDDSDRIHLKVSGSLSGLRLSVVK